MEKTNGYMVTACSGASNTGAYTDGIARLASQRAGVSMVCLPKVAIGDEALIANAKGAARLVVLDGCPIECAKKIMNRAGVEGFKHLVMTDFEIKKGVTPVIAGKVESIVREIDAM